MPNRPGVSCRHRRRPILSWTIVSLWVVVLAVATGPSALAATERPRVLVIGDSIILGTQGNIAADLPDWDVVFDADVSRSTASGLDVLAEHGTEFSVVVVALGANDAESPGVFTPRVSALLDALATVPHVVWLTIHEVRPYYPQANSIIRDQVARHPNAVVGDWNATIRPGDVGSDGLHLTGQGSVAMAGWVAALVRLVAAPPPSTTTSTTTTVAPTTSTTVSTVVEPTRSSPSGRSTGLRDAGAGVDDAVAEIDDGGSWAVPTAIAVIAAGTVVIWLLWRRKRRVDAGNERPKL